MNHANAFAGVLFAAVVLAAGTVLAGPASTGVIAEPMPAAVGAPMTTAAPAAAPAAVGKDAKDAKDAKDKEAAIDMRLPAVARYDHAPLRSAFLVPGSGMQLSERALREIGEMVIALTFDDGPDPINDPEIIRILAEHNAAATFFVIGRNAAHFPDVVRTVAAAGNEIGNHTWQHPMLTSLSVADQTEQLRKTNATLVSLGITPIWFRPPYGDYDSGTTEVARTLGLETMLWTTDSRDWKGITPQNIFERADDHLTPGAVILMHSTHHNTVLALPAIIEYAQAQGYRMVTLSQWKQSMLRAEPVIAQIIERDRLEKEKAEKEKAEKVTASPASSVKVATMAPVFVPAPMPALKPVVLPAGVTVPTLPPLPPTLAPPVPPVPPMPPMPPQHAAGHVSSLAPLPPATPAHPAPQANLSPPKPEERPQLGAQQLGLVSSPPLGTASVGAGSFGTASGVSIPLGSAPVIHMPPAMTQYEAPLPAPLLAPTPVPVAATVAPPPGAVPNLSPVVPSGP